MKVYGVHSHGEHLTRDLSVTRGDSREGEGVIDRLSWKAVAAYTHEKNYRLDGRNPRKDWSSLLISVAT